MSKPPSRPRPPSKPTDWSLLDRTSIGANSGEQSVSQVTKSGGATNAELAGLVLEEFEAVLRSDTSLDPEAREILRGQFSSAIKDAAENPDNSRELVSSEDWKDAVERLKVDGDLSQDEALQLSRQFERAMQPLQQRESKLAFEFARRLESDGEEEALRWFKLQTGTSQEDADDLTGRLSESVAIGKIRAETVNSKSRRLRGPPKSL